MTDDSEALRGLGRLRPFLSGLPGPRAGRGSRSPEGRSGTFDGGGPIGRGGAPLVGGRAISARAISLTYSRAMGVLTHMHQHRSRRFVRSTLACQEAKGRSAIEES